MKQKMPNLDDYANAIIDRDSGIPYTEALENHGIEIKSNQFYKAVERLDKIIIHADGSDRKQRLEEISMDPNRKRELFRMEEWFIQEQYDRTYRKIQGESQKILYSGTLLHPENRIFLVYYAIISHNPELKSMIQNQNRGGVVFQIKQLPNYLRNYFQYSLALGGIMNKFEEGKKNSPLAVLQLFDLVYQKKTGDVSLFDLNHKEHLHKWNENFKAPLNYWQNTANVEEAVYHTLIENHPELSSDDRKTVFTGILSFPDDLSDHFSALGLRGLMGSTSNNSPRAVLEVFDRVYQREMSETSLFDKGQEYHVEFNGQNRLIRKRV